MTAAPTLDPGPAAHTTTTRDAGRRHPRRGPLTLAGDALLWLLSVAGVLCLLAVGAAFAFHVSLIMFRTGSMSPTIPTGSLAIVRQVPASEVHVGDVTTVDRDGELPVTHRVIAVEPAPDSPGGQRYSLRLKGDANDSEDPAPYVVDHVRTVMWSVPGAGRLVARAQDPRVMIVTALVMGVLVTAAFWPRRRRS